MSSSHCELSVRVALVPVVVTVLLLQAGAAGFEPTPEQWDRLHAGEILSEAAVSENGHHGGQTAFVLKAPRELIWQALNDYEHLTDIFEGVDSVNVLTRDSMHTHVEVWTQPMLFRRFRYVLRRTVEQLHHRLSWRRVGGDFAVNEGSWDVRDTEYPGAFLLVHRTFVRIHRAFPEGFTSHFTVKKMMLSDRKLRTWVNRRMATAATKERVE